MRRPPQRGRIGSALLGVITACVAAVYTAGCGPSRTDALEDLQASAPEIRARGLQRLEKVARDEDYLLFVKAASDPAATVRLAAIEALGARRDPRAVDLAAALLGDPEPTVQGAAAACLARLPSPKARPYLIESYGRRGAVARSAIARALAGVGVGPAEPIRAEARQLWERNEAALDGGTLAERVGAAEELGRSGTPAAVERLRRLLGEPGAVLASAAVRGLAAAGDRAAVPDLLPLLKSPHPELREAAALAMGTVGDPKAAGPLATMAGEPTPVAIAAAVALSRLPGSGPAACAAAVSARAPGSAGVLARHAAREGASCEIAPLEARLRNGGVDALAALAAAGPLRATRLLPRAAAIAGDPAAPAELREASIRFLGEAGGVPEGELLTGLLERPTRSQTSPPSAASSVVTPATEGSAATAPGEGTPSNVNDAAAIGPARADGNIVSTPIDVETLDLLLVTAKALGALHHAPAVPVLLRLLTYSDPELRAAAVGALGAIDTEDAWAAVARAAVGDGAEPVRLTAIALLGERRKGAAVETLVQAAQAGDGPTRAAALRALSATGAKLPSGALEAFARSGLPEAAVALGWLGHDEARPLLLAALRAPVVAGRAELIEALGRLGDRDVGRALVRELHHDQPEVRVAACGAVAQLRVAHAREVVTALAADDYYVAVRRACAKALEELDAR